MVLSMITKDEMINLINESKSMRQILLTLGLSTNGSGGYRNLKNKMTSLGVEVPNYKYYGDNKCRRKLTNDIMFCENSTVARQHIKKRIINDSLIKYQFGKCKNPGKWEVESLTLQLEHINGINNDNRLENLIFLCPNCHSQTATHGGKKNKK